MTQPAPITAAGGSDSPFASPAPGQGYPPAGPPIAGAGGPPQPQWSPGSSVPAAGGPVGGKLSQLARLLMLLGLAAAAVGCLLSWAEVSAFGFSQKLMGTETDDGKLFLGVAVVAIVLTVLATIRPNPRPYVIAVLVLSAILLLGGLYEIGDINSEFETQFGEDAEDIGKVGSGLYVLVLGSIVSLIGAIKGLRGSKSVAPAYSPPPTGAAPGGWNG